MEAVPPVRPARQSAPRRAWAIVALLTAGASTLAVTTLGALSLMVDSSGYRYWPADGHIDGGDGAQIVEVEAGEEFLLWKYPSDDTPECTIREAPSGEVVALETVDGRWERGAGAVPYVAFARGTSDSDRVQVSCDRTAHSPLYLDHPQGPRLVDGLGPWWPLPIVGAAAGIGLVVWGIVVARGGQRRIS
ncbi:hypothetical protein [Nocardioides sp. SYSU DS0651]|uniref:hypothetical protein n=1 Tax=Nocardioides sp. SYSU DS0651 TaxID=3415955 RepID=UPI003F4BAA90